ncbi:tol-pal system YbgF family protein [Streptomyces katsurahamanus]|uniref:Tetratricopeptide repeat protein n=1 Tax=Streptomyces katsurahamanus TaxID=2577098 RepID=A0ABW9NYV0_9ACTN|nr:tetratricopeptide repeat protein [Streptomyces katsurahamanus]MQS38321.1 tetratricopeptide repeat protein [Streptomyces katsurahamanus]
MAAREPNESLARLHREAGWTLRQFAQAVNRVGTERGTPTKYQEPSVHQWLKGYVPKEGARPLILEALTRKLQRIVTHRDAGLPASADVSWQGADPIEGIIDLGSQDMSPSRRGVLGASLFSVALAVPDWPDVVGRMESVRSSGKLRIGVSDVEMVAKMTDRLGVLYDDFGGRHARPMAAAFLVNTVAPYLRANATEGVRKAMTSAASYLCYLTGWMAVDERFHGIAQHYYVKGLELAGASADHAAYCHILRGMSVQAVDLGHGATAVRLADAASAASPESGPRMRAFLAGQQAHSYAVAGDRVNAFRSIRSAEEAMDKAESPLGGFEGHYNPATLAYHVSQVRYALGDIAGSVTSLQSHFRLRDPTDTRVSSIRFSAMLAERQLEMGHLEAACKTWNQVLDDYPKMHSGRVDQQVSSIGSLLRPYRANAAARETYERSLQVV